MKTRLQDEHTADLLSWFCLHPFPDVALLPYCVHLILIILFLCVPCRIIFLCEVAFKLFFFLGSATHCTSFRTFSTFFFLKNSDVTLMLPVSALTAVQTPITTMFDCSYSAHTESTHMHPATQGFFLFCKRGFI